MMVPSTIPEREDAETLQQYTDRLKRALTVATEAANLNALLLEASRSNQVLQADTKASEVPVLPAPRVGELAAKERVWTWKKSLCFTLGEIVDDTIDDTPIEPRSVWIGNLHPHTALHHLRDFFSSCGEVRMCEIILDLEGTPKGVGRVTFGGADAVPGACNKSGRVILKRRITVARSREELNFALQA